MKTKMFFKLGILLPIFLASFIFSTIEYPKKSIDYFSINSFNENNGCLSILLFKSGMMNSFYSFVFAKLDDNNNETEYIAYDRGIETVNGKFNHKGNQKYFFVKVRNANNSPVYKKFAHESIISIYDILQNNENGVNYWFNKKEKKSFLKNTSLLTADRLKEMMLNSEEKEMKQAFAGLTLEIFDVHLRPFVIIGNFCIFKDLSPGNYRIKKIQISKGDTFYKPTYVKNDNGNTFEIHPGKCTMKGRLDYQFVDGFSLDEPERLIRFFKNENPPKKMIETVLKEISKLDNSNQWKYFLTEAFEKEAL